MKKIMIQKITHNTIGISEQSTLLCEQKIVTQSSDFPVRRTGSYRHKKSTGLMTMVWLACGKNSNDYLHPVMYMHKMYRPHYPIIQTFKLTNVLK